MQTSTTVGFPVEFDVAPYRLSGIVVGTLLNHAAALAALGTSVRENPYKAPPKGPVLYVKPRNTLSPSESAVPVPKAHAALEIGASLGLVIGRTACGVDERDAMSHIAGYTLVADLSAPHDSFYRPSLRFKVLDGSCLVGPRVTPSAEVMNPDELTIRVSIDGEHVHTASTSGMVRTAARLIADVSDFMTLRPGDILMLGIAHGAPRARAGQAFVIECEPIGRLSGRLEIEESEFKA